MRPRMGKRISVVEDIAVARELLYQVFENLEHTVAGQAETEREAISSYLNYKPDLTPLDISLPMWTAFGF